MLELYENIKKYRKLNKWTQEEMAKKSGVWRPLHYIKN